MAEEETMQAITPLTLEEEKEKVENINFKMVTFSLAGKDYGVDIMTIKEIAKADKFTYVPNTSNFVKGVYNLRGDIIPIIDMRLFFHLPAPEKEGDLDNMLIVQVEDRVYGVIVDKIDKVVGLNSENIQPPHPIFGDINIKFISGVVEKDGALFIILDMVRMFSMHKNDDEDDKAQSTVNTGGTAAPSATIGAAQPAAAASGPTDSDLGFLRDSLKTLKNFCAGPVNEVWVQNHFAEWAEGRSGAALQLKTADEAEEFLLPFYSVCTNSFWSDEYASAIKSSLPDMPSNNIQAWDIGCGKGYEAYSIACLLKGRYPGAHIKVWANDNDIMAISNAPNMSFDAGDLPEYIKPYMIKGKNGYVPSQELKDSVVFEYHDVLNGNQVPTIDLLVARDFLSFVSSDNQLKLVGEFTEKLRQGGVALIGSNEQLSEAGWQSVGRGQALIYIKD
ncbi:MAG: chemotaxis protein CheW [Spirochaetaceae bacterium]|jgi:purine-binding chemotaxis protein CheW|nr:chemotaxis protein CheW [Spirochaetaceae bacterium]